MKELVDFLGATNNLETFFLFFIPGFISLLVAGLIGPVTDDDFSKRIVAMVGYSALNYAALRLTLVLWSALDLAGLTIYTKVFFVFVLPFIYPFIIYRLRENQFWGFSTPFPSAWDQFFSRRHYKYFVRAKLKNGEYVLGYYGRNSISSQTPAEQMILLERAYDADSNGNWIERKGTVGLLLRMSECESLEFIIPEA